LCESVPPTVYRNCGLVVVSAMASVAATGGGAATVPTISASTPSKNHRRGKTGRASHQYGWTRYFPNRVAKPQCVSAWYATSLAKWQHEAAIPDRPEVSRTNASEYTLQSAPFGELGGAILAAFKVAGDGVHRGPDTAPSRYSENCERIDRQSLILPPQIDDPRRTGSIQKLRLSTCYSPPGARTEFLCPGGLELSTAVVDPQHGAPTYQPRFYGS